MSKKLRLPIPEEIASDILFISDRTCCVCTQRGKEVQIHHIDEDTTNNNIENLCTLCFDCHNKTMIKGGFGRKLNATQILKYRSEWIERVKARKERADKIVSIKNVAGEEKSQSEDILDYKTKADSWLLKKYLDKILIIQKAQLLIAQAGWEGTTFEMLLATSDMIDFYEEILVKLSTFYPQGHFEKKHPKTFFSEIIASRFSFYRFIGEPEGEGTGGSIARLTMGNYVMNDTKLMVTNMAEALIEAYLYEEQDYFSNWKNSWSIDSTPV